MRRGGAELLGNPPSVSVAIPTRNAGHHFRATLAGVRAQRQGAEIDLVVLDSESADGTPQLAARYGARVQTLPRSAFNHGEARALLMRLARGEFVALLTQDAVPATPAWVTRLLEGFRLSDKTAIVTGPYLPRPSASVTTRRELHDYWRALGPGDQPCLFTAADIRHHPDGRPIPGPATFFTSANGCVRREAWEKVPFRDVPYAEDQRLALDMLAAGYAKVFHPGAAVIHSHDYPPLARFRRTFDEFRGLREVYGHVEGLGPRVTLGRARIETRRDRAQLRTEGVSGDGLDRETLHSFAAHLARGVGAGLGSRADRLPPRVRGWCSLEGRSTFEPSY